MVRGLAYAVLLGVVVLGAWLRWTTPEAVEDLRPRPDALEYEEGARNLAEGRGYYLIFDGGRYPPRYPPGFSVTMVPAMWLGGGRHGAGIWTVQAFAALGLIVAWRLAALTSGVAGALLASVMLAVSPLHVRWSQAVMSDVPAATVVTALAVAALACLRRNAGVRGWAIVGASFGLSALLRPTIVPLVVPVAVALLVDQGLTRSAWRRLAALVAGVGVGLLPTLAYGYHQFGSPFSSGYGYWVVGQFFAWRYVVDEALSGGGQSNLRFYLRELAGLRELYPWPVPILVIGGAILGWRRGGLARALVIVALGMTAVLLALYLPFFWQWNRFLLPAVPLVLAVGALTVAPAAPRLVRFGATLLALAAVAIPATTPRAFDPPDPPLWEIEALRFVSDHVEQDAVLVARSNAVLMSRLFRAGTDRLWLPLGLCDHRADVRRLQRRPYDRWSADDGTWVLAAVGHLDQGRELTGTVRELLRAGRPVYLVPTLDRASPVVRSAHQVLGREFTLQLAAFRPRVFLYRVRERSAAQR